MTYNGMRCEGDGEFPGSMIREDAYQNTWLCWEHFQDLEAPNLKIIRYKISQEILAADVEEDAKLISSDYFAAVKRCKMVFAAIARGKVGE
jgi:hypothetical protein